MVLVLFVVFCLCYIYSSKSLGFCLCALPVFHVFCLTTLVSEVCAPTRSHPACPCPAHPAQPSTKPHCHRSPFRPPEVPCFPFLPRQGPGGSLLCHRHCPPDPLAEDYHHHGWTSRTSRSAPQSLPLPTVVGLQN